MNHITFISYRTVFVVQRIIPPIHFDQISVPAMLTTSDKSTTDIAPRAITPNAIMRTADDSFCCLEEPSEPKCTL